MNPEATSGETAAPSVSSRPVVTLQKSGNVLTISTSGQTRPPETACRFLEQNLAYTQKRFLYGAARYENFDGTPKRMDFIPKQLYRWDQFGRMVCNFGLLSRVLKLVDSIGLEIKYYDQDPPRVRKNCYETNLDNVKKHFQFRPRQEECLQSMVNNPCGLIHAITGFGKMVMIAMICLMYPHAKIHVITRSGSLVKKMVGFLTMYLPDIGQVGYGRFRMGRRITVFTVDSLHRSDYDADIILCDEGHELISNKAVASLVKYRHARPYTFTASPEGRGDGADIRLENVFGPEIFFISYPEGVKLGLVVPIRVEWSDVRLARNPCSGMTDVYKKRNGIWRNDARNIIIASKARTFEADEQVQILVETVDHAMNLKQYLPEFHVVYAPHEADYLDKYKEAGMVHHAEQVMRPEALDRLRIDFEKGKLLKVISTSVWATGIDPQQLTALVRAEGTDQLIDDIQGPGRVSRTHSQSGKAVGVICDFMDYFDSSYHKKSRNRFRHYSKMGWEQVGGDPSYHPR